MLVPAPAECWVGGQESGSAEIASAANVVVRRQREP